MGALWSDEFEYEGLPDKTKWDYEEGFIRNKELQIDDSMLPQKYEIDYVRVFKPAAGQ
jgi:hypothetical protein